MADHLENLLDSLDEARVVDRLCQLDVSKVAGTFRHVLSARFAFELPIDRAEQGIVEALFARLGSGLVHGLGIDNVDNAHALDLFGRKQPELYLLDRLKRRTGVRKIQIRHLVARRGLR